MTASCSISQIINDPDRPEGGHALIALTGVAALPADATITFEPVDQGLGIRPLTVHRPATRFGGGELWIAIGPEIVDALQPDIGVTVSIPGLAFRAECSWPALEISGVVQHGLSWEEEKRQEQEKRAQQEVERQQQEALAAQKSQIEKEELEKKQLAEQQLTRERQVKELAEKERLATERLARETEEKKADEKRREEADEEKERRRRKAARSAPSEKWSRLSALALLVVGVALAIPGVFMAIEPFYDTAGRIHEATPLLIARAIVWLGGAIASLTVGGLVLRRPSPKLRLAALVTCGLDAVICLAVTFTTFGIGQETPLAHVGFVKGYFMSQVWTSLLVVAAIATTVCGVKLWLTRKAVAPPAVA